jgi:hypothetical protein
MLKKINYKFSSIRQNNWIIIYEHHLSSEKPISSAQYNGNNRQLLFTCANEELKIEKFLRLKKQSIYVIIENIPTWQRVGKSNFKQDLQHTGILVILHNK